jgi:hypothetical protein
MKKLVVSPITNTIYLTNVKEHKDGWLESIGEKQDYTQEAVRAVYEWFLNQAKESEDKMFQIKYGDRPWLAMQVAE